jgi:two-component system, chemotaxis family, sensor kinase CheA
MEIEQKILIVDDVRENLVAMESILDDCGAKLISVQSGNDALKVLLNERISLILLDIQMPGIDGYETAKLIRGAQRTKDIPIIFVSAISKEERNISMGYKSGAIDFLHKPVDPEIVSRKVDLFLQLDHKQQSLEQKNRELLRARANTNNILNNVEEGLFLMDNDGLIKPEYSKALENIFKKDTLAGENLMDVLKSHISDKSKEDIETYLELVLDASISEDIFADLNPFELLEYEIKDQDLRKYLNFKFKRIYEDKRINELIITVTDLTQSVKMENELQSTSEQSKKQLELLNIIDIDPQLLKEFLKQCEFEIEHIKKGLLNLTRDDQVNEIYGAIHAIKGNAAMLNLGYISEKAHFFEQEIVNLKYEVLLINEQKDKFLKILTEIKELLRGINSLMDRVKTFYKGFSSSAFNAGEMIIKAVENTLKNNNGTVDTHITFDHSGFDDGIFEASDFIFLRDIVVQLTRNTIAHGLRNNGKNISKGKDYIPTISLTSAKIDGDLVLNFSDNGKGLQLDKIKEKALAFDKWEKEELEQMSECELSNLIFQTGISTANNSDLISGRGVGMNLIKQKIEEHGGSVEVESKYGEFCKFKLKLPSHN